MVKVISNIAQSQKRDGFAWTRCPFVVNFGGQLPSPSTSLINFHSMKWRLFKEKIQLRYVFFLVIRQWRTVTERSMYIYIYDLLTSFPLIFYQTASLSTFYDSLNIFMKKYMHQWFFLVRFVGNAWREKPTNTYFLDGQKVKKLKVVGILRSAVKYLWTQCYLAVETDVSNNVFQYTRV